MRLHCAARIIPGEIRAWMEFLQQEFRGKLQACRAVTEESDYVVALTGGQLMKMERAMTNLLQTRGE